MSTGSKTRLPWDPEPEGSSQLLIPSTLFEIGEGQATTRSLGQDLLHVGRRQDPMCRVRAPQLRGDAFRSRLHAITNMFLKLLDSCTARKLPQNLQM